MAQETRRYDRLAEQYSQYPPRYPDRLISHLAAIVVEAPASDLVVDVDVDVGTGIFTRQLRAALPVDITIVGIEPSPSLPYQGTAHSGRCPGAQRRGARRPPGRSSR